MPLQRKEIRICMGSSCFSRGNRATLLVIQQYLKDHHLEKEVILKGNHCFDKCNSGPLLRIGSTLYENVRNDTVLEILEIELGHLVDK